MELALQFVTGFSSVLVDHSVAPVGRRIGYLFNYKTNIEELKGQLQKLKDERDKVQHWVDEATIKGEEIEAVVQRWLNNVEKNIEDAEEIIRKAEETAHKEWFRRSLRSRYRVGKGAAKEIKSVAKLKVESSFERVSYRSLPQGMGITSVKGYEDLDSRKQTLNGVTEALKNPNINMVGIYGMGGIGKTTLAKEVAIIVKQEGEFPVLVFLEVSQNQDIKKIQGEIADKLGLEFREETLSGRADRLCDRLKKEKRILIILDNLWEKLDLEKVGIPFGEAHKECKILLTSRDHNVLSRDMETQKNFPVGILPEKEAWELFKKMAGDTIENPDLQVTATEVAKECAGLPLAIVTVAKALKNKSSSEWKNALLELRRPSSRNFTGIQAVIYSTIELSYNNLETEELKATFLLCGIIGNTIIMDLLKYGIGLGVFQETKTMEETRDRVNTLLCSLEASCLLVDRSTNDKFAIHDVVRDVALSIASRDKHVLTIQNAVGPREWPYADSTGILLFHSDISELPEEMEYPKLKFLCIWNPSLELPDNFLNRMRELRVLDFTEMRIPSFPSSVCLLGNLRSLCLYSCVLQEITVIGELKKIEILGFVDCDVEQLPKELGKLTRLKLLDLSDCPKIKVIPRGVISSLCRLEELYLGNSFKLWEIEDLNSQASNASLAELRCLPNLTALDIHIPNTQIMLNDLFSERLARYRIFIGDEWDWYGKYETERTLKLKHGTSFLLEDGTYKLLQKTEDLYLDEFKGEASILWKLDREGLPQLKHLHVQNSPDIRYIINSMNDPWISSKAFPILASFFLQNMINLEKICHGKLPVGSFSKLRIIKVGSCGRLESLFSLSLFKGLVQLQEIEVTDCEKMVGIVTEERLATTVDNAARSNIELCQLRSLMLKNLSSFVSFCYKDSLSTSWSTRSNSMSLLDEKVLFPNLEELKVTSVKIAKIWPDQVQTISSCLKNLKILNLEGCGGLTYLFPSYMLKNLMQLKTLVIRDCNTIESVIEKEEINHLLFPELYDLRLENLPKLTGFCAANLIVFPSLRWLVLKQCPEMKTFNLNSTSAPRVVGGDHSRTNPGRKINGDIPLFDEKLGLPNIERLIIDGLPKVEKMWHNQLAAGAFSRIDYLSIWNCRRIKYIFPCNMMSRLQRLDRLGINLCDSLQVIFEHQVSNLTGPRALTVTQATEMEAAFRIVFPQITVLELWNLQELKSFYPGAHTTEWPLLKKLDLYACDKLTLFASKFMRSQEAQSTRQLVMPIQQPLFMVDETTFHNLEELKVEGIDAKTELWCSQFSAAHFHKLKALELIGSLKQPSVSSLSFIQILPNLERLHIGDAPLEEIFQCEVIGGEQTHSGRLTKFSELKLSKLPVLKHLWKEELNRGPVSQDSRTGQVSVHGKLRKLVPSLINFQTLTILEISKCHRLINLGTILAATSLVQLTKISISDCERIEEILVQIRDDVQDGIAFTKLKHLGLNSLPSLASFCHGNCTFEFPSLEEVIVRGCPRMQIFCHGVVRALKLQKVQLTEDVGHWNGDLNTTIKHMFTETGGFFGLEHLKLSEFPELEEIWNSGPVLPVDFKSLKLLEVNNCNTLRYLITACMAQSLVHLEVMKIENCSMMKEIIRYQAAEETATLKLTFPLLITITLESLPILTSFCSGRNILECPALENLTINNCPNILKFASLFLSDHATEVSSNDETIEILASQVADNPGASFFEDKVVLPKLKEVVISHMDKIKNLWSNNTAADSLRELKIMKVRFCQNISSIFPASATMFLLRLEQLTVDSCSRLEYIVAKDEEEAAAINFIFPQLSSLELGTMPELKSFYQGVHSIEWPVLNLLHVFHCDKLKIFSQGLLRSQEQPLFFVDKILQNLEALALNWKDINIVFPERSLRDHNYKLKFLQLQCFHVGSVMVPMGFLDGLQNLDKVGLACSDYEEILPYLGFPGGQMYTGIFTWIRNIRLYDLPYVTYLWKEDWQWRSVFEKLETLEVWLCDSLINLAPPYAPLSNLKTLDVWDCRGLVNLFTSSAAKNLVQLTEMKIRECETVREVVSDEGDETEIIFSKLKRLELDSLSNLSCFCLAFSALNFPSLEEVIVYKCPKLELFSEGMLTTPLLHGVCLTKEWDQWRWDGDLNITIRLVYTETNGPPENHETCWIPPPIGTVKLNTTGCLKVSEGVAAAGGLMRDHHGNWLEGFSINMEYNCGILQAQLLALEEGLRIAVEKGLTDFIVETDAETVLNLINHADTNAHPLGSIIEGCRNLIDLCDVCFLQHTPPEGNLCADFMANLGALRSRGLISYTNPPPRIVPLLLADAARISLPEP